MRLIFLALSILVVASCQTNSPEASKSTAVSVTDYFNYGDTGVRLAGIKMIPIETPIGKFKVWTKSFGNNPRIKVLLLHGGPAMSQPIAAYGPCLVLWKKWSRCV